MRLVEIRDGYITIEVASYEAPLLAEVCLLASAAAADGFKCNDLPSLARTRDDLMSLCAALAMFFEAAEMAAERPGKPLSVLRQAGQEVSRKGA